MTNPQTAPTRRTFFNLTWKTLLLLAVFNLAFAAADPLPGLARLSLYNTVFPGRTRLPFGETPEKAYNFSLYQLPAMFAVHEIARPKTEGEIRLVLLGDSSVWGYLLPPQQTLAAQLQQRFAADARFGQVKVYNLGYPTITLTKDLLLLEQLRPYQPDLVIWLTTLEAFPVDKQLDSPILQNNPELTQALIAKYGLNLNPQDERFVRRSFWDRTIFGSRRALADLLRLQMYGPLWAATGIDQYLPANYERPQLDLEADQGFQYLQPPALAPQDLSWDVLQAGLRSQPDSARLLLVNEPILISQGQNSDLRYNFFYPRWAYDQYRQQLAEFAAAQGLPYLDAWNLVPLENFTNSAIHLDAQGEAMLAQAIFDFAGDYLLQTISTR